MLYVNLTRPTSESDANGNSWLSQEEASHICGRISDSAREDIIKKKSHFLWNQTSKCETEKTWRGPTTEAMFYNLRSSGEQSHSEEGNQLVIQLEHATQLQQEDKWSHGISSPKLCTKNMHGIVFTLPMWSFTCHLLRSIKLYRDKSVIIVISFAYPIPSSQIHRKCTAVTSNLSVESLRSSVIIHHWTLLSFARFSGAHWQYEPRAE